MLKVRDLMSTDIVAMPPEATLRDALELFAERHISGAPVVSGGRVLGVVSATDLIDFETDAQPPGGTASHAVAEEMEAPGHWLEGDEPPAAYFGEVWADTGADLLEEFQRAEEGERDLLSRHTASEIMSRPICWVPPDLDIADAAAYLTKAGVHRVLVLDGGRLVGVLSAMDIVRAVGKRSVQ
jgi:CBS domain-containing protein